MKKIGYCCRATKRGTLTDVDPRGFLTVSCERPAGQDHTPMLNLRSHKYVVFLHTHSCCTYVADLGPPRLDLAEEELAQEPIKSRCGGRRAYGDGRRAEWRRGRC
jgi:hypothetical protein